MQPIFPLYFSCLTDQSRKFRSLVRSVTFQLAKIFRSNIISLIIKCVCGCVRCVCVECYDNTKKKREKFINLFDKVPPKIAPFTLSDKPAKWGDTVTATCTVISGDYPIQIDWFLNGQPIDRQQNEITIVNTSKRVSLLTIDGVNAKHAGEFTCVASSTSGSTSYSTTLAVNGISYMQYTIENNRVLFFISIIKSLQLYYYYYFFF